jgi:uncharacterized iron-regulated membrane protein
MDRKKQASVLRSIRKIHRRMGITLIILLGIIAISGLLLGWKKNTYGYLMPQSQVGTSTNVKDWLTFDSLQVIAFRALRDSVSDNITLGLQRIDARPQKGMVKFVFDDHYWGVQLDATTGDVLAITRRRSDFIENIHDGSILDILFKTNNGIFKLIYSALMGTSLLIFAITGFWLWYGPKVLRRTKK